jgi:ComF family protein
LRELVHLLKYGRVSTLANPLGEMLLEAYPRDQQIDVIVPMPMHWTRRWKRGFNQASLLAKVVGRRTGIPVSAAVRRKRSAPPQAGLSSSERRKNVSGGFSPAPGSSLRGKRVLLVDDVLTTGATASACAKTLKRAGAAHVSVLALARTDRRYQAEFPRELQESQTIAVGAA